MVLLSGTAAVSLAVGSTALDLDPAAAEVHKRHGTLAAHDALKFFTLLLQAHQPADSCMSRCKRKRALLHLLGNVALDPAG